MATKTRSATDMKAILTEIFQNRDVLAIITDQMLTHHANTIDEKMGNILKEAGESNKIINDLKTEIRELKQTVADLKTDISKLTMDRKTMEKKNADKRDNEGKIKPVYKHTPGVSISHSKIVENVNINEASTSKEQAIVDSEAESREDEFVESKRRRRQTRTKPNVKVGTASVDLSNGLLVGDAKPKQKYGSI